tara:strand:- start:199 stop:1323 length:1125 start_codon:yes stop_codon:yes gene_type:complete
MKILILLTANVSINHWHTSKVISREIKIYQELTKLGNNFTFLSWGFKTDKDFLKNKIKGKTENIFPYRNFIFKLKFFRYFYSFFYIIVNIKNFKDFQIVKSNQLIGSHLGLLLKLILNTKFICRLGYEPNMFWKNNKNFLMKLLLKIYSKIIYKYSDIIIVTSLPIKNYIIQTFNINKNRIKIIPNYVDTKIFKILKPKKNKFKRFVTITRFDKQKNLDFMFKEVLIANGSLDIIGAKNNFENYRLLSKKINLKAKFLGPIDNIKLPNKLSNYDFYLSTSLYEGNPKTILEAMSSKIPVISTSVDGTKDIIKDGKNGFFINNKKGSLKKKINFIKNKKLNLKIITTNARNYVLKNNSLSVISNKENKIYKKVCI